MSIDQDNTGLLLKRYSRGQCFLKVSAIIKNINSGMEQTINALYPIAFPMSRCNNWCIALCVPQPGHLYPVIQ